MDRRYHFNENWKINSFNILIAVRVDLQSPFWAFTFFDRAVDGCFVFFLLRKIANNKPAFEKWRNYFLQNALSRMFDFGRLLFGNLVNFVDQLLI